MIAAFLSTFGGVLGIAAAVAAIVAAVALFGLIAERRSGHAQAGK